MLRSRGLSVALAVFVSATLALACGEDPGNTEALQPLTESEGGGSSAGEMLDVEGCAYFDGVTGLWRLRAPDSYPNCLPPAETDPSIIFGPEGYCPDPCLTSDHIADQLDGTNPVTIKTGKNLIGTFRWSESVCPWAGECAILAETDTDGPARQDFGYDWIPLTPAEGTHYGRPSEGEWVRVYGRWSETKDGVMVWEIRYPNADLPDDYQGWYWWKTDGQPWAQMELLDCE